MAKLSTILVPTTPGEINDLHNLFRIWKDAHDARQGSSKTSSTHAADKALLRITFAQNENSWLRNEIERSFKGLELVKVFTGLEINFLDFSIKDDIYYGNLRKFAQSAWNSRHRKAPCPHFFSQEQTTNGEERSHIFTSNPKKRGAIVPLFLQRPVTYIKTKVREIAYNTLPIFIKPSIGLKSGPNLQFFKSLELCSNDGYTLLNEVDMIPIIPFWQEACNSAIDANPDSLIIGSRYKGLSTLGKDISSHINGNALYATHDKYFREIVLPRLQQDLSLYSLIDPTIAYDTFIAKMAHMSQNKNQPNFIDPAWYGALAERIKSTNAIQNYGRKEDILSVNQIIGLELETNAALIHSRASLENLISHSSGYYT